MEVVFEEINNDELKSRLQSAATGHPSQAHDFFKQFDYNIYRANNLHNEAYLRTIHLLNKLQDLDPEAYKKIHKGTPFYFCGDSSFKLGNFVNAVYFFDAAVSEDIKNDPGKRTPAVLFMELDSSDPNQNALPLTQIAEQQLSYFIDVYNQKQGSIRLSLKEVRLRLLHKALADQVEWRTLASSLISYVLESEQLLFHHGIRVEDGTWEPFLIHVFKGCVLFESLLKANPTVVEPGKDLNRIFNNSEINKRLGVKNQLKFYSKSLADIVNQFDKAENSIQADIVIAGKLRNTIGHNIGWRTNIKPYQYARMVTSVMNAILHTISGLYKELSDKVS